MTQKEKALRLRQLHLEKSLLILPNAWDVTSAKLVELSGFPAVATASAAMSLANGYEDGEKIPFDAVLKLLSAIAKQISVPLTADVEHGFAAEPEALKQNTQALIQAGVAGINLEDGKPGHQGLETTTNQCRRIEAVRQAAEQSGIPLVINARLDLFLQRPGNEHNLPEAIERAKAYINAGADCVYPIMINQYEHIRLLVMETGAPVNVNLQKAVSDLRRLEAIGVSRVSLGPGFLNYALAKMHHLARDLREYNTTSYFDQAPLPRDVLHQLLYQ